VWGSGLCCLRGVDRVDCKSVRVTSPIVMMMMMMMMMMMIASITTATETNYNMTCDFI
jgi:hypothetical protein